MTEPTRIRDNKLRDALLQVYWRLQRLLAPRLEFNQHRYETFLAGAVAPGCRWLDLGCGHQLLPSWRRGGEESLVSRAKLLVGLDSAIEALHRHRTITSRARGVASCLPFASATFDLVTANMVVEHFPSPLEPFREVQRVLRPGGRFVFHTPNRWGHPTIIARMVPERLKAVGVALLEGRAEEDRFRTYYRANSQEQIRVLAERCGFRVVSVEFIPTTAMFALATPLAALELLWIRITVRWFPELCSNLIVTLERQ
jgi:SAM-dependent methyltransferase